MDDDRNAIACQPNVKLYPVRAVKKCALERNQRILRSDCRRAAMTDNQNRRRKAENRRQS